MKKVLRTFKENKQFTLFFILGLVVIGIAIFAPQLSPYDPLNAVMTESLQEPSSAHPFGTDKLGRDLLSRVIFGTRTSLIMTLCLVAVIFVIGTFLGVIAGYFGGVVENKNVCEDVDDDLKAAVLEAVKKADEKMEKLRVADAITEIFNIFRRSNKYIDETTPWTLAKDEEKKDRLATVLYNLTEAITIGASLLSSFMPETSEKILAQLNTEKRTLEAMDQFGLYPNGNKVTEKPEILFARMDVKEVLEKVEAMKAEEAKPAGEEENAQEESVVDVEKKPEITYDDFAKLQFQIGQIVKCEEVPKSKKLLCSQVKIGSETRQIISGIKAWYKPDQMVGKKVMVVTNLKPAKLAGMLSEGMILCAEDDEGNLALMTPEKDIKPGSEVC